jgi:N-acetylneuraminate synthase
VGVAKSFIDMAVAVGAKVVKFQLHIAEAEGTGDEPFRVKFSDQDNTRQDYWRRINFSTENWKLLADYCKQQDVEFLCTPFSIPAAKLLFENGLVKRWKVGSGQATDFPLIDFLCSTKLPLIISTGLINNKEIGRLRDRLERAGQWNTTTLLHCVSRYPVPLEGIDLHLMEELTALGCRVGYSDHSGNENVAKSAIARGASIVEVHMTPHPKFFGPDVSSSLTPDQLSRVIAFSNVFSELRNARGTKDQHFEFVKELRPLFRKGIYWARNMKAGEKVEFGDLLFLKPVRGVDVIDFENFIGKQLIEDVFSKEPLKLSNFKLS